MNEPVGNERASKIRAKEKIQNFLAAMTFEKLEEELIENEVETNDSVIFELREVS